MGDIPYLCGMPWAYGDNPIGGSDKVTHVPKCFWLDGDGSDSSSRAVSIHLPDFLGTDDKLAQYRENRETMCSSTPRFAWWSNLKPHSWIPFFKPPLEYQIDSASKFLTPPKFHPYTDTLHSANP